ncbi:MAG: cell division protein ZapD [Pseudomonadota bacterium]|nr:cell division protein ZapD [Pseudomonadota bacterium]
MTQSDSVYIHDFGFKDAMKMCLEIERQWLYVQDLLNLDLDSNISIQLLSSILKLMDLLSRSDTKVKLIRELSCIHEKLRLIEEQSETDVTTVSAIKLKCDDISKKLAMGPRILSGPLITDPFLSKCYHRQVDIFNSPPCNTWRQQNTEEIKLQCQYWLHTLEPTWHAIEVILWSVRASSEFDLVQAVSGFYRDKEPKDVLGLSMVRIKHSHKSIHPVAAISHRWLVVTLYHGGWVDGAYQHIKYDEDMKIELSLCY